MTEQKQSAAVPRHIGIIMDGNGRWAKKRGLPRSLGHKAGAEAFRRTAEYCGKIGIEYLTVYAFSSENWNRPQKEIDDIFSLLRAYIREAFRKPRGDMTVRFVGDRQRLDGETVRMIAELEEKSVKNHGLTINIAVNYGGRGEIARAASLLAAEVAEGKLRPEEINEELISRNLYTAGQPDPDLIIRTSGEKRLSNFLLWQSAYSEFVFMDVLWPDFGSEHIDAAIAEFMGRQRRFGGI